MGAAAGPLDGVAVREQLLDFLLGEGLSGLDGGLAGGHVEDFVQEPLGIEPQGVVRQAVEKVPYELRGPDPGDQDRK